MKIVAVAILAILIVPSGITHAQKVVDCSKMSPSELRNVDDIETTCKKASKSRVSNEQLKASLITEAKKEAKEKLSYAFKDPSSVKFMELRVNNDGVTACGYVNAKNSYGAYTGFKKFYGLWMSASVNVEGDDGFALKDYLEKCNYLYTTPMN